MNKQPRSTFVPGPGWRPFEYNGRSFMVDRGEFTSAERTPDGWELNSVPACVVVREGTPLPSRKAAKPGA